MGDARVRINTAAADELNESLPGIEPERARLIVAYREEHGYLRGPEDLGRVEGIDRGTVAALASHIDWSVPSEHEGMRKREWAWALAAVFGVEPSYLVDREQPPPLDADLLEGLSDLTTREITREALRLPERERRIVPGIVRQFGGGSPPSG